jgi:hypothetical protein
MENRIQIFNDSSIDIFSEEIIDQVINKKVYLICQSDIDLSSTFQKYLSQLEYRNSQLNTNDSKLSINSVNNEVSHKSLIDKCNDNPEAAILYPKYNVGIYPDRKYNTNEEFINEIETYLHDLIIVANEKYLRSISILFVIEGDLVNYAKELENQINILITNKSSEIKYLQKISLIHNSN